MFCKQCGSPIDSGIVCTDCDAKGIESQQTLPETQASAPDGPTAPPIVPPTSEDASALRATRVHGSAPGQTSWPGEQRRCAARTLAVRALILACLAIGLSATFCSNTPLAFLGLLGPPMALAGFILGFKALAKIQGKRCCLAERGLAIAAMAVSGCPLLACAYVIVEVVPNAHERACRSSCENNEKQIALAVLQYAQDFDETLPRNVAPTYWDGEIFNYVKSDTVYRCPDDSFGLLSYMLNNSGGLLVSNTHIVVSPAATVVLTENENAAYVQYPTAAKGYGPTCRVSAGNYGPANEAHPTANVSQNAVHSNNQGANYAFLDGHVEYYPYDSASLQQPAGSTDGGPWLP